MPGRSVIRTPDQRVRVFVSSTLGELAPERAAARAAIERLRLAPVMFELGARPHPPRELYRAYLAQSDVFVGMYWERYGWVAPGEAVSGLEDEYRLAGSRPRLLYIKEPSPRREERLAGLVGEFKADDRASYQRFATAEQLAELLENDLAVMLAERFDAAGAPEPASAAAAPPNPLTPTVGREDDVARIAGLLAEGARLVTLTGAGGTGKTRLAVEVSRAAAAHGPAAVHYVALSAVEDRSAAIRGIADALAVRVEGSRGATASIADRFGSAQALLVLDNLEQIAGVGPELVALLERCPGLRILATSRHALRVEGETEVRVRPLALPADGASPAEIARSPAVRLFVARARAASAEAALAPEDAATVAELCRRLDGLPLAIELAAARSRLLPPAALLARLGERLDLVGGRDGAERHRTLRRTLDWSERLLGAAERALLARLGVFGGGWTLDAGEAVCGALDGEPFLDALASLVDKSLVEAAVDAGGGDPRFQMLETVRAYAIERLEARPEAAEVRGRHLAWYLALTRRAQPFLCGPEQEAWSRRIDPERANLRAAAATALARGAYASVVELAWNVFVHYATRDAVEEPEGWLESVAAAAPALDPVSGAKLDTLRALTRQLRGADRDVRAPLEAALEVFRARDLRMEAAVALKELGFVHFVLGRDVPAALETLEESSRSFESVQHDWGVALIEAMLGTVRLADGDLAGADRHHRRSLAFARRIDNAPLVATALRGLALVRLREGEPGRALGLLDEAAPHLRRARSRTDAASTLDVLAGIALARGAIGEAARAAAVAAATRRRLGVTLWPTIREGVETLHAEIRERVGAAWPDAEEDAARRDALDAHDAVLANLRPLERVAP